MPTPTEAKLRDLLAQAERDLVEAEQRHERQVRVVAGILVGTEARAYAETGLREIERTAAFIRANQALIQSILD